MAFDGITVALSWSKGVAHLCSKPFDKLRATVQAIAILL
jgi:hypothetical protein